METIRMIKKVMKNNIYKEIMWFSFRQLLVPTVLRFYQYLLNFAKCRGGESVPQFQTPELQLSLEYQCPV